MTDGQVCCGCVVVHPDGGVELSVAADDWWRRKLFVQRRISQHNVPSQLAVSVHWYVCVSKRKLLNGVREGECHRKALRTIALVCFRDLVANNAAGVEDL